jgi:GAF domain-containing protein
VAAVREFTGAILNPYDLQELLHRLMGHAVQIVDAAGAGIMLAGDDGELSFVAASEQRVIDVELLQAQLKQGVCHEAFYVNEIVHMVDAGKDERWPQYTERVVELGLRSVIGIPLNAVGQTIGVINIYREAPGSWSDEEVAAAEILAAMGAGYILNANQMQAQNSLAEQLHSAIESRDLIGQAKGILMARSRMDGDEAFDLLRRWSQDQNRKLRDIAEEVVVRHAEGRTVL